MLVGEFGHPFTVTHLRFLHPGLVVHRGDLELGIQILLIHHLHAHAHQVLRTRHDLALHDLTAHHIGCLILAGLGHRDDAHRWIWRRRYRCPCITSTHVKSP